MKLLALSEAAMVDLTMALWEDEVPAYIAQRFGDGYRIEFLRPHECPTVQALIDSGRITRG